MGGVADLYLAIRLADWGTSTVGAQIQRSCYCFPGSLTDTRLQCIVLLSPATSYP